MALVYVAIELAGIGWGIPGKGRLFTYQMDEWHSLQAVRGVLTKRTNNIGGAAGGMMGYFISSAGWLAPFAVLKIVNPWVIKSVVTALDEQQKLFIILRLNTIAWGLLAMWGAIMTLKEMKISDKTVKGSVGWWITAPIWLTLSNYFKYDMAVVAGIWIFWWRMMKYIDKPTRKNLIWAGAAAGMGIAMKLSGLPMMGVVMWGWWRSGTRKWRDIFLALAAMGLIVGGIGMPDIILGISNWHGQVADLTQNLSGQAKNIRLGMGFGQFWLVREFPAMFGRWWWVGAIIGLGVAVIRLRRDKKTEIVLVGLAGFGASLLSLGIWGGGNRATVLIPELVILAALAVEKIPKKWRTGIIILGIMTQLLESGTWLAVKAGPGPRQISTIWMEQNIDPGVTIGVENIPIYQKLPDGVNYEFYKQTYEKDFKTKWKYKIVDSRSVELPKTIIITDGEYENKYWIRTPKKDLLERLRNEGYKLRADFKPDLNALNKLNGQLMFNLTNLIPAPTSIEIYQK